MKKRYFASLGPFHSVLYPVPRNDPYFTQEELAIVTERKRPVEFIIHAGTAIEELSPVIRFSSKYPLYFDDRTLALHYPSHLDDFVRSRFTSLMREDDLVTTILYSHPHHPCFFLLQASDLNGPYHVTIWNGEGPPNAETCFSYEREAREYLMKSIQRHTLRVLLDAPRLSPDEKRAEEKPENDFWPRYSHTISKLLVIPGLFLMLASLTSTTLLEFASFGVPGLLLSLYGLIKSI